MILITKYLKKKKLHYSSTWDDIEYFNTYEKTFRHKILLLNRLNK